MFNYGGSSSFSLLRGEMRVWEGVACGQFSHHDSYYSLLLVLRYPHCEESGHYSNKQKFSKTAFSSQMSS